MLPSANHSPKMNKKINYYAKIIGALGGTINYNVFNETTHTRGKQNEQNTTTA